MEQNDKSFQKPLRLWPGVVIVTLQWLLRFGLPIVAPEMLYIGVMGGVFGGVLVILWWMFFSRAPWLDRFIGLAAMIVAMFATFQIVHESIAKGAMGMLFFILTIPVLSLAFVLWAVAGRRLSTKGRRVSMVAIIFLACGAFTLIRTGGFTGDFDQDIAWRWSITPEERLLSQAQDLPASSDTATITTAPPAPAKVDAPAKSATEQSVPKAIDQPSSQPAAPVKVEPEAEWPGFRGAHRDGIIHGVRIQTDWSVSPPIELWRRSIGPGWSSFAVSGNLLYTQEQRGDDEVIACYKTTTGKPVWTHRDKVRFWESNAGPGPRGTPTLHNGRVYAFGATGIVNALNAADGTPVWSRNAAADTNTETPGWGFASSPVVVDDVVIVAAAGKLIGYDIVAGKPRWMGPDGGSDYSSPHLIKIDGIEQVLLLNQPGAISVAPSKGTLLWKYALPSATRIVQPAIITEGDLLISEGDQRGMRRITVTKESDGWKVKERWTSIGLKPYFNDFVVHKGHAYGFDGSFLSCIDLKDGTRKWKGGRYGHGQLVALADQDLLLVLSEDGELALVRASAEQFTEVTRFRGIEGKTWNHPVIVGNLLLVRNGEEMAAFRLPVVRR